MHVLNFHYSRLGIFGLEGGLSLERDKRPYAKATSHIIKARPLNLSLYFFYCGKASNSTRGKVLLSVRPFVRSGYASEELPNISVVKSKMEEIAEHLAENINKLRY